MEVPQNVKNRTNVRSNDPTPECMYGKEENLNSKSRRVFKCWDKLAEKYWRKLEGKLTRLGHLIY